MAENDTGPNRLKPVRSRKWLWRLVVLSLVAAAMLFFAPAIIANTPLLDWLIRKGLADLHGTVEVSSASLGWFSPVELRGVTVRDAEGNSIAEIDVVRSDKTLLTLARDPAEAGTWKAEGATVHLTWKGRTSNVEEALHEYFYGPSTPAETGASFRVHVTDSKLLVRDADTDRRWTVEPVEVTVTAERDRRQPLTILAKGPVTEPEGHGTLALEIGISRTTPSTPFGVTTKVEADRGPFASINGLIRHFQSGVAVDGAVSGKVDVTYLEDKQDSISISADVAATDFALDAPEWLAEPLRFRKLRMPGQIAVDGGRVTITSLALQSDVGSASAEGTFDFNNNTGAAFQQPGAKVHVDVDLAQLAMALPKTLRFRDDVQLKSGRVQADVSSIAAGSEVKWTGRIVATDLQGTHAGQHVTWKQPLTLTFSARAEGKSLPRIERLNCQSDFVQAEIAERGDKQFILTASCQLTKLREQLTQFVDVDKLLPDGNATITCTATQQNEQSHRIEGEAKIQKFQITTAANRKWQEPEVVLKWAAIVETAKDGRREARAGAATLQAGREWIWLSLNEPMPLVASNWKAHAKVRVYGDLARWRHIAGAWLPEFADWSVSGIGELGGRVRYHATNLEFHDLKAEYQNFRLQRFGLNVVEPKVTVIASGRRDAKSGSIQLLDARITCPSITATLPVATVGFEPNGKIDVAANGTFHGDIARLERWFRAENEPASWSGTLAGSVQIKPDGGATRLAIDAVANVAPAGKSSSESKVTLTAAASFDSPNDRLLLEQMGLSTSGLSLQAAGDITTVSTRPSAKLRGQLDYDWKKLEPLVREYLGDRSKITGQGSRPFRIEGTLTSPISITGEFGIGWDSLQSFGCKVGNVYFETKFTGDSVQIKPIQTTLNQGRAYLAPGVRLEPAPSELTVAKGSGVERAKISQEMCDELLGYAAPALARATDADGEVTIRMNGGRIPLKQLEKADVSGQMILHAVRVSATSPMLRLLSTVLQTPATVALQKEAVVNFRVVNGRVFHDKLELVFPGLTVKTSGSVGFDGSLELLIESPMPPRWVPNVPGRDVLAKQTIKIPLRGTLAKPQLDEEAVRRHLAGMTRDAARGAVNDRLRKEFEKGLERLFPKKK